MAVIGIRREDKSVWERRTPLVPEDIAHLVEQGVVIHVEASENRCFSDREFRDAGARVTSDLSGAEVILGVKEIPADRFERDKTYLFFSHTIKGQPANMAMLQRLLDLDCTLLDYELITDENGVRTIAFGRHAGLAGAIDTLWALGERWRREGIETPLAEIRPAFEYGEVEPAVRAIERAGKEIQAHGLPDEIRPLTIGVTGEGGKVFGGAVEIFERLPFRRVSPDDLPGELAAASGGGNEILLVGYGPEHLVEPVSPELRYSWEHYVEHPDQYRARFGPHLSLLTAVVHGIFWKEGYPRFILQSDLARIWSEEYRPKLEVITEITCDLGGSNESLVKIMDQSNPTYVYDPRTGEALDGWEGRGPLVLPVDILPTEISVDSSRHFSEVLTPLVAALAAADSDRSPENPDLATLKSGFLAVRGKLLPPWDAELAEPLRRHAGAPAKGKPSP